MNNKKNFIFSILIILFHQSLISSQHFDLQTQQEMKTCAYEEKSNAENSDFFYPQPKISTQLQSKQLKTEQETLVDETESLVAPILNQYPSAKTATIAISLSEKLRKWALKDDALKSLHLKDALNIDEQLNVQNARKMHRHSGQLGAYTFDRDCVVNAEIAAIKKAADLIFLGGDEDAIIRAIKRMNPKNIAKTQTKINETQAEIATLEMENAKLKAELEQLEGTNK